MIKTTIQILSAHGRSDMEIEEIVNCLNTLYSTPVGTVALDREFGIDFSILDLPINIVEAKYSAEIIDKTRRYENRVEVRDVIFGHESCTGSIFARVVIGLA